MSAILDAYFFINLFFFFFVSLLKKQQQRPKLLVKVATQFPGSKFDCFLEQAHRSLGINWIRLEIALGQYGIRKCIWASLTSSCEQMALGNSNDRVILAQTNWSGQVPKARNTVSVLQNDMAIYFCLELLGSYEQNEIISQVMTPISFQIAVPHYENNL